MKDLIKIESIKTDIVKGNDLKHFKEERETLNFHIDEDENLLKEGRHRFLTALQVIINKES